jgi:hypothetical protein
MVAMAISYCMAEGCNEESGATIYIGHMGYPICQAHVDQLYRMKQLVLREIKAGED